MTRRRPSPMPIIAEDLFPPLMRVIRSYPQLTLNSVGDTSRAVIEAGSMIAAYPDRPRRGGGRGQICRRAAILPVRRLWPYRAARPAAKDRGYGKVHIHQSGRIHQHDFQGRLADEEGWLNRIVAGARIGMRSDCGIAQRLASIRIRGILPMSSRPYDTDLVATVPAPGAWTAPIWPMVDRRS